MLSLSLLLAITAFVLVVIDIARGVRSFTTYALLAVIIAMLLGHVVAFR